LIARKTQTKTGKLIDKEKRKSFPDPALEPDG